MPDEEKRPRVGVAVYVLNGENQLLCMHRISQHAYGTWAPPGGHLEYGETFLQCAKREMKEETGLDVDDIEVMGVTNNVYEDEGKQYVTLAVRAKIWWGEPKIMEPEKCDKLEWFDLDKLPSPLMPAFQDFLKGNPQKLLDNNLHL